MEHAGDNAVHLSVGSEMEASDDQGAAHAVILGPIAWRIRGEGLKEPHVELLPPTFTPYTGIHHHMSNTCDTCVMMIK